MALEHIIWLRPHAETTAEHLDELIDELKALKGEVPGILQVSGGRNLTDRANGCSHGIIVTLENMAALEPYLTHPSHQVVGGRLREAAELLVMDFEV